MSFENKRQRKHTVDRLGLSLQPASTRRGDLRKGHVLRQRKEGRAPEYVLPMVEVQAPDMTTIKKLPQLWLPILRFFFVLVAGRPVESDSMLPTAKFQSPGSANAVTTRFMHVFLTPGLRQQRFKKD
jgi:hypothetical protein